MVEEEEEQTRPVLTLGAPLPQDRAPAIYVRARPKARGVAKGGGRMGGGQVPPPEQRMTKKKFSPLFLKRPIKKLSID